MDTKIFANYVPESMETNYKNKWNFVNLFYNDFICKVC